MRDMKPHYPRLVLFDLLTALLDSWSLWNRAAGSEAAGRAWRARYLQLTYGCGNYVAYETLVREAARQTSAPPEAADQLERDWLALAPWSDAQSALKALAPHCALGIVTNCSQRLGERAAAILNVDWSIVVTAEQAGFYKPHPRPYQLALEEMDVSADDAAFVAGSGYDLFGTERVGLRTYWHNRIGLAAPDGSPKAAIECADLAKLPSWLASGQWKSPLAEAKL
jgi:2-haloacid dehalogenase